MVGPLIALAEYDPEPVPEFDEMVRQGIYNRQGYTLREWKAAGRQASTWAGAESHRTRYVRFMLTGEWGDNERQGE